MQMHLSYRYQVAPGEHTYYFCAWRIKEGGTTSNPDMYEYTFNLMYFPEAYDVYDDKDEEDYQGYDY